MRIPKQPAPKAAESAPPAAAPAPPPAAAPIRPPEVPAPPPEAQAGSPQAATSDGVSEDRAAFFRALVEETEREQRGAVAAKEAQAEAEPVLLSEGAPDEAGQIAAENAAPSAPAGPPSATPARGGMPEDKDALLKALAEEDARQERRMEVAQPPQPVTGAGRAPSPEDIVRGRSSAATELRVKAVADQSGYALAEPAPPAPARPELPPLSKRRLLGAAIGLLVLLIFVIIATWAALSRKKLPAKEEVKEQPAVIAQAPAPPPLPSAPELPPALKEAAGALANKARVEVEVDEAAAEAVAEQMPILTPAGDFMLDLTNLHVRDKNDNDESLQEMQSEIGSAVAESLAAQLREKGLTPVETEASAAASSDEPESRLKVVIRATPAWAGFHFLEVPGTPAEAVPFRPVPSPRPRPMPTPHRARRIQFTLSGGPPPTPPVPVQLWDQLLSGGLTLSARFRADAAWNWSATAAGEGQGELVPCGLRLSIVQLIWQAGEREYDLIGPSDEAEASKTDTTLPADAEAGASGGQAGAVVPFHPPKRIHEVQLTAQMRPDRTCLISGFCQYDDVDLHNGAAEAGKLAAAFLASPEADWNALWNGKADRESLAASCRNVLRLDGGPAIAEILTADPDRLPKSSEGALASVLKEERGSSNWAIPFLGVNGPCADAAMIGLAREANEENEEYFLEWVAPAAGHEISPRGRRSEPGARSRRPEHSRLGGHSSGSIQAACCALIDLGRPAPEVNALIDGEVVKAFSEVRSPRACLAFPPKTAETVLNWLLRNGTENQRIDAVAAVVERNIEQLHDLVQEFVSQSLRSEPVAICRLCKEIEKAKSPLAFEILSSVAERQLMQSDVGDRFPPWQSSPQPAGAAGKPAPPLKTGGALPAGRYSRTVAAVVCAGLARFDKFEAGKVLVQLLQSPGPATRYCAIETLIALDDVDASPDIRARFEVLNKQPRNAYEQQEWELLNPTKNKLCRYYIPLLTAQNAVKNGINLKEVIESCNGIIKENPSPTVVEQAKELKAQAEKLLERTPGAPH
jgi:hypothetical protein